MDGGLSEALFWVCDWQQWAYEVEHFRSVGSWFHSHETKHDCNSWSFYKRFFFPLTPRTGLGVSWQPASNFFSFALQKNLKHSGLPHFPSSKPLLASEMPWFSWDHWWFDGNLPDLGSSLFCLHDAHSLLTFTDLTLLWHKSMLVYSLSDHRRVCLTVLILLSCTFFFNHQKFKWPDSSWFILSALFTHTHTHTHIYKAPLKHTCDVSMCHILSNATNWEWKEHARGGNPRSAPADPSAGAGKRSPGEVTGPSPAQGPLTFIKEQFVCSSEHNCCWQVFRPQPRGRSVAYGGAGGAFWVCVIGFQEGPCGIQ